MTKPGPPRPPLADDFWNKPRPGSLEAVAIGCTCPIFDNNRGAGTDDDGGWDVSYGCPVHWPRTAEPAEKES